MKIAIDARFYGLEHTGLGRYTQNLVQELAKIDQDNHYTLFVWSKYKDLPITSNFTLEVVDADHHTVREQILLSKAIGLNRFDLVHFPHFIVPIVNTTPFIVTIHDLIKHKYTGRSTTTLPWYQYELKNLVYRFDMWWAAKMSKAVVTPTNIVKKELVDFYKLPEEKVFAIGEGVEVSLTQSGDQSLPKEVSKLYILYVGKMYPHKNVEFLIDALAFLPEEYQLVVVGKKNVFWDRVLSRVNNKKMLDRVVLTGFVGDEELASLYTNTQAFVSASKAEGFGLPPLEAMSLGSMVVVSDIPVHREVCGEGAVYFSLDDPRNLADKILEIKDSPEIVMTLQEQAQKQLNRYSWETMAREILEVYRSLIPAGESYK